MQFSNTKTIKDNPKISLTLKLIQNNKHYNTTNLIKQRHYNKYLNNIFLYILILICTQDFHFLKGNGL